MDLITEIILYFFFGILLGAAITELIKRKVKNLEKKLSERQNAIFVQCYVNARLLESIKWYYGQDDVQLLNHLKKTEKKALNEIKELIKNDK